MELLLPIAHLGGRADVRVACGFTPLLFYFFRKIQNRQVGTVTGLKNYEGRDA